MLGMLGVLTAAICTSCVGQQNPTGLGLGVPEPTVVQQLSDGCARFQVRFGAGGAPTIEPVFNTGSCALNDLKLLGDTAGSFDAATGTLRVAVVIENIGTTAVIPAVRLFFHADSVKRFNAQGEPVPGTPDILAHQADSVEAGGRRAQWFWDQWLAPSGQPQVLQPGARTQRRWVEFRGAGWTGRVTLKLSAWGAEVSTVPPIAPDSVPRALLNRVYRPTQGMEYVADLLIVGFRLGTPVAERARVLSLVGGRVVGGLRDQLSDGGAYVIQLPQDTSQRTLRKAEAVLTSQPSVRRVVRYYAVAVQPTNDRPNDGSDRSGPVAVPAVAPDTIPRGLFADSAAISDPDFPAIRFIRGIVSVLFKPTATHAERQAAVAAVGGVVVGGSRVLGNDGYYIIRLVSDTSVRAPKAAVIRLQGLSQVQGAYVEYLTARPLFRRSQQSAVPPAAPDTLPPALINSLPNVTDAANRTLNSEIVMVIFRSETPQPLRQAAVDAVRGQVIGGIRSILGEGLYYLRIRTATTAGSLHRAAAVLEALPQVAVVYLLDAVPHDQTQQSTVPAMAPDSLPRELLVEGRVVTPSNGFRYYQDILLVSFKVGTALSERTRVLRVVSASVVGGFPNHSSEGGTYVILLPHDSTQRTLIQAEALIGAQSSVLRVRRYYAISLSTT